MSFQRPILQDRADFLGLVAHELKTPVAAIKAYAGLLEAQLAEQGLAGVARRPCARSARTSSARQS